MREVNPQKLEFGDFVLDLNRGTLRRFGEDINLRPQAFEVLFILAARKGELVAKDELLTAVWGDVSVTDDSLTQCIVEIRKTIGDHSRSIIRTVPKRGFIFDPPELIRADASSPSSGFRKSWLALPAIAIIVAIAVLQLNTREDPEPIVEGFQTTMSPNSIAVLPFVDMSEGQDQQYFGDGIAEEILDRLTKYPDLVVIARTSSFLFRDRQEDAAAVGRRLNSAHVLDGSIRKTGSRLRITAQLIETGRGTQVWSESFDRELTVRNLLEIQSEVAASVAGSIASDASPVLVQRDLNPEVATAKSYDLYLEGMFYLQQIRSANRAVRDPEIYEAAADRFDAAIADDPDWAPAHAALGRTLLFRAGMLQDLEVDEAYDWYRLAKEHLQEAISLDPDHALAYSSLAHVLYRLDFDFPAAAAAYARARELGGYVPWSYALFLRVMGRFDEAIGQYRLAIERDPLSAGPRHQLASTYRCAGRDAESIAQLENVLRLAPGRNDLYIDLAYLYLKTGNQREGRALFEQYADPESASIDYGPIYVMLGMVDKAYEVLEKAESAERWWLEDVVATLLILGEKERALKYLEAAASDDPRRLVNVLCINGIQSLADEERYRQLLRKAGLPERPL